MPRQARKKSNSGIYHVMLRGINQQVIFEDEEDYLKFLEVLKKYKKICGYKIFAYCIMNNHIHLLIQIEKEDIDLVIKRIAGSFVYWYNWKYKRKGHLFQDRFKSEPVEDDAYFLTVMRYIHQNPVKAFICGSCEEYSYSSYGEYIYENKLVDVDFCYDVIGKEQFVEYNNQYNYDICLDIEENKFRLTDEEAQCIIKKLSGCKNTSDIQRLPIENRDEVLKSLRVEGLSIRQISRLTGVSFNVVRKF